MYDPLRHRTFRAFQLYESGLLSLLMCCEMQLPFHGRTGSTSDGIPVRLAVLLKCLAFLLKAGERMGFRDTMKRAYVARLIFGLLVCEFPVNSSLDLTGLLQELRRIRLALDLAMQSKTDRCACPIDRLFETEYKSFGEL